MFVEVRIPAGHPWHSGIRRDPDRMIAPVLVLLQLDELGKASDQLGDPSHHVMGSALYPNGYWRHQAPIDMRQDNGIGIDDPVSTGHRFGRPGFGKAARGHGRG